MKAAYFNEPGAPDIIQYGDLPTPEPNGTEVLVKVNAVSVNPIDTYIRNGAPYWELPKPFIIGCDVAGVVEAVGPDAKQYKPGDRVWGSNQGLLGRQGTFAEYAAVDECWLYPTPENVKDEDAAAVSLVGITAHLGLVNRAQLQPGETIYVHGGSGGVGSMVVQMAKALGARVIASAGAPEKAELCKQLGADEVVEYKTVDEYETIKQLAPDGVNVFWETLREPNFINIVDVLAKRGRIVLMAGRDARPEFPVGPFYVKGCSMHGFAMFTFTPSEQAACARDINQWLRDGKLNARIDRVMPLSEAAEAHRLQEENTLQKTGVLAGKLVLNP